MAPFYKHFLEARDFDLDAPSAAFKGVWSSPSNYAFTILLLLGGDVVARALAQLAGSRITPVAFSFGMSVLNHRKSDFISLFAFYNIFLLPRCSASTLPSNDLLHHIPSTKLFLHSYSNKLLPSRMGILRDIRHQLRNRRIQTHARRRHTLHHNQHLQPPIPRQRLLGPRPPNARLRILDGSRREIQSHRP